MAKIIATGPSRREAKSLVSPGNGMDVESLRSIVEIVEKSGITKLEWRRGDESLHIERGHVSSVSHGPSPMAIYQQAPQQAHPHAAPAAPVAEAPKVESASITTVTSPFVGTFYRSPSPDAPSFVEVGQHVRKGQVLCIVEAMKLMNEIEAEVDGKILESLVQNGHAVEFGQALFKIDRSK